MPFGGSFWGGGPDRVSCCDRFWGGARGDHIRGGEGGHRFLGKTTKSLYMKDMQSFVWGGGGGVLLEGGGGIPLKVHRKCTKTSSVRGEVTSHGDL